MKKIAKTLLCCILLFTLCLPLAGCGNKRKMVQQETTANQYHVQIITNYMIRENFIVKDLTEGHTYVDMETGFLVEAGDDYDKTNVTIIDDKQKEENVFSAFPGSINYDKERIVIYSYTTTYLNPIIINDSYSEDNTLYIAFSYQKVEGFGDSITSPKIRRLVVKLDRTEHSNIKFVRK